MKPLITTIALLAVAFFLPVTVLAQTATTTAPMCPNLTRTLVRGESGADVSALQQFLSKNLLAVTPTGYFGPLTQVAVQEWQSENGIVSSGTPATNGYGIVGPRTRAAMSQTCLGSISGEPSTQPITLTASPTSGTRPLAVNFRATGPQGADIGSMRVNFADGASGALTPAPICVSCNELATVGHVYLEYGTYTATLVSPSGATLSTATITVADGPIKNLTPIIYSLSPTSGVSGTLISIRGFRFTTSNSVHFGSASIPDIPITFSAGVDCGGPSCHSGINQFLTFTVPSYSTGGRYSVSVENAGGTSNVLTFTVTATK
jgi:peptidoglycan hydrolase-like protein with peptidoglycan-binding domain